MIKKTRPPVTHSLRLDVVEVGIMKRSLDRKIKNVSEEQTNIIVQIASDQGKILQKVEDIERRMTSIEIKLGSDTVTKETFIAMKEDATDQEQRIRDLEKKMWTATGSAGILGGVISIIISYLLKTV